MFKRSIEEVGKGPWYERPVSATVGRLSSPITAAMLGTMSPLEHTADKGDPKAKDILRAAGRDTVLDKEFPLRVSYGDIHPIDRLRRTWDNPRTSTAGKVLGTLGLPFSALGTALSRGDHYDPYSHEVVLYNQDPAILAHELGHAQDYARADYPTLRSLARIVPPVAWYQEADASARALKLIQQAKLKNEAQRANRVLGGGLGSYVGGALGSPFAGAMAGQAIGHVSQPFTEKKSVARGIFVG